MNRVLSALLLAICSMPFACGGVAAPPPASPPAAIVAPAAVPPEVPAGPAARVEAVVAARAPRCGGDKLTVHFYNVSQALSALVALPDGRHILVDTGDLAKRAGCGQVCATAHEHLVTALAADLGGAPIDLMWITHQHSDHIGGAADILGRFVVKNYVDNGRDLVVGEIKTVRDAAAAKGVPITVVEPGHERVPIDATGDVKFTAIAPSSWITTGTKSCDKDRNECSILLRIDYCSSSVLFTGDAEVEEEALLDPHGSATLLQVGHHGSDTSSGAAFIEKVHPEYGVISAGKEGEGMNRTYCHPRESTVQSLTQSLGGPGSQTIRAFDAAVSCKQGTDADWHDVAASDHLWTTERDGDIVLTTTGDGTFLKE